MKVKVIGMSRGLLFVDENNAAVIPFLQQKNIRVKTPPTGTPDENIIDDYLTHRIFVTNNTKGFH